MMQLLLSALFILQTKLDELANIHCETVDPFILVFDRTVTTVIPY